ncbi:MAG: NAD(P)-binding domain-containing protein, partial [Prevotella copri]|nr:NAD(P)-binding domain-containing protein [Segatella copri]MDY6203263.1 NAD(P)-binding domain-containing protein [Segatella copri]
MKITIIGAGAMGGAMAEGLLQSEKFTPSDITVSDHNQPVLDHFASEVASVTLDNQLACHGADIVCVVVKPWCVEKTLKGIKEALNYKNQKLVVVAAGVPSANIKEWLDKDGITPTFFLVMPNIAIAYKQSMTFITPVDASATEIQQITEIFDELGESL